MQFEITDRAAIIFAEEFYAALVDGLAVDAALAESRKAIYGDGNDVEGGGQSCSCEYATGSCSTCRNYLRMRRWFPDRQHATRLCHSSDVVRRAGGRGLKQGDCGYTSYSALA